MTEPLMRDARSMIWKPYGVDLVSCSSISAVDLKDPLAIRGALAGEYTVIVTLEPGDATVYCLVLSPGPSGFFVMRAGCRIDTPATVLWEFPFSEELAIPISNGNDWSATFIAWWIECLRCGEDPSRG